MSQLSTWNAFQHQQQGRGYTHAEMVKMFDKHKKKHHITRSPRKSRVERTKKLSPSQSKKLKECQALRKQLSPNRWNECQKKYQGKYSKEELKRKCSK